MRARAVRALAWKELRELTPLWLVAIGAVFMTKALFWGSLTIGVYAVFAFGLGAVATGHEIRHRTMDGLLAQPVPRLAVLATKMGVLAALLISLGIATWWAGAPSWVSPALFAVPLACAFCLAPLLALAARTELGGMVFAAVVPAGFWIAGQTVALRRFGMLSPEPTAAIEALRLSVFVTGIALTCAAGAAALVVSFQRFQSAGGFLVRSVGPQRRSDQVAALPARRRLSPYWALLAKEVRLYVLPAAVALLFTVCWIAAGSLAASTGIHVDSLRSVLSGFYLGGVTFLVGAIVSAEERELGTLSAQSLLPMAAWRQWTVKIACALVVLWCLIGVLPVVLEYVSAGPFAATRWLAGALMLRNLEGTSVLALIFALSVYVSSLSRGAVRAVLVAIGAAALTSATMGLVVIRPLRTLIEWAAGAIDPASLEWVPTGSSAFRLVWVQLPIVLGAGVVLVALRFAMRNHLSFEPVGRLARRQVPTLAATILAAVAVQFVVGGVMSLAWQAKFQRRQSERRPPATTQPSPAAGAATSASEPAR